MKVPYDQAYPEVGFEDMRRRVPCICKIARLIAWSPTLSMDEIISRTIGNARHEPKRPAMVFSDHAASLSVLST